MFLCQSTYQFNKYITSNYVCNCVNLSGKHCLRHCSHRAFCCLFSQRWNKIQWYVLITTPGENSTLWYLKKTTKNTHIFFKNDIFFVTLRLFWTLFSLLSCYSIQSLGNVINYLLKMQCYEKGYYMSSYCCLLSEYWNRIQRYILLLFLVSLISWEWFH